MSRADIRSLRRFRHAILSMTAIGLIGALAPAPAEARHHHVRSARASAHHSGEYSPPYAAIVVDANSGRVIEAENPDSLRHPASLTKIMTLYLLFEQLEAGKVKLDSRFPVSAHAAAQDPSKLGLEPGQTIAVEDAIKAVVTKSANDVAVLIAEAIGGSEDEFARMMTRKAHALGMTRTTYVNASGLPNDEQITTARDQALLGRAVQDRFPKYYRYFSTLTFQYHGASIRNHNHLLGRVDGIDGIKTGYTVASGFNLVASVHRGDRRIVAVVLGGTSGAARDARMRTLIEAHIAEASTRRTVPSLAEPMEAAAPATQSRIASAAPEADAPAPPARARAETSTPAPLAPMHHASAEPIQPIQVKTISVKPRAVQASALAPLVSRTPQAVAAPQWTGTAPVSAEPVAAISAQPAAAPAYTTPDRVQTVAALPPPPPGSRPGVLGTLTVHAPPPGSSEPRTVMAEEAGEPAQAAAAKPVAAHGGYMIQLGAFPDEAQAKQRLKAAQNMAQNLLGNADAFTERVVKGSHEFYRARFAGLDKDAAEAACHYFHKNDIACMALRSN
jgi:D-alanyl-D-alanine carboxypeptidase